MELFTTDTWKKDKNERDLNKMRSKGNFDDLVSLSSLAKSELHWWIQHVGNAYNVINHPPPQQQMWTTDASHMGWGRDFQGCPILMSRIERKYCSIGTSYLAALFKIFILLHIWLNRVRFGDFLPMRTLCDAFSVQSWTYLVSSGGNWSYSKSKHHVNYPEMSAILLRLETFAKDKSNTHQNNVWQYYSSIRHATPRHVMQYNTTQCNAMQYNAMQYNTIQYNAKFIDTP